VFLVNSRYSHFSAALLSSISKLLHLTRAPLLPKLRGQLAEFLNEDSLKRLRILSSPTCVGLRYNHQISSLRGFSWWHGLNQFVPENRDPHYPSVLFKRADLPTLSTYRLEPGHPIPGWSTLPRHHFTQTFIWWYRNINLFSITYAFRPQLRY
jgi:hypothetical protein